MKNTRSLCVAAVLFAIFAAGGSPSFGQGSLTPPGAPAKTMLSLDQIGSKVDTVDTNVDTANATLNILAAKAEKRTPINSLPYAISAPGSYYVTGNLPRRSGGGGITISASNVTVYLNGVALDGTGAPASTSGIVINDNLKNVQVYGGAIANWPGKAVAAGTNTSTTVFEDLRIRDCGSGGIASGNNCVVRRCEVNNCAGGPGVSVGSYCVVDQVSCTSNGKGIVGIQLVKVSRCSVISSNGNGIDVGSGGTVTDCFVKFNSGTGIASLGSALIANCNVEGPSTAVHAGSTSTVQDCTLSVGSDDAIAADGGCLVQRNLCSGNGPGGGTVGIHTTSGGNRIQENHIRSVAVGILLT
ncbi:MAG: right-handed parallel beta-helix repeat-containing protein, partial [Chthoniobacterales bacterium]